MTDSQEIVVQGRYAGTDRPKHDQAILASLASAITRARDGLLARQDPDGHWVGELQGDTILETEYILLLAFLGRERADIVARAARYVLRQQLPEGGWNNYPGGPVELSVTVKAYFALKLAGHDPEADALRRAREIIRSLGGAARCNSFTKFYLALLGQLPYANCPAVPPEMMFLPSWAYFNIHAMSSWTRTIVIPLTIFYAFQPVRKLPPDLGIAELFLEPPETLLWTHPPTERWLTWTNFFLVLDGAIKRLDKVRKNDSFKRPWSLFLAPWSLVLSKIRSAAVRRAEKWLVDHFADSDGVGAIFPPMIYTIIALRCLGYADESPEMLYAHKQLDDLQIDEGDTTRLQPCLSPVWDTALTLNALADAGGIVREPQIERAVRWLLEREVRRPGDWSVANPHLEPGGWFFEYRNGFYPDTDDTAMVLMALAKTGDRSSQERRAKSEEPNKPRDVRLLALDSRPWTHRETSEPGGVSPRSLSNGQQSPHYERWLHDDAHGWQPVSTENALSAAVAEAQARGLNWLLGMQNRDGGWAAFDRDVNRELLTKIPFADHNAMLDPSCPDITARVLEALGYYGYRAGQPQVDRALDFLHKTQESEGCWPGRWGVNYIYGTWQVLQGLANIGFDMQAPLVQRASSWLKETQQLNGGWGETCQSYDDPRLKGQGTPTASQTAWALLGLRAADEQHSAAVAAGIRYLLDTQQPDGAWHEEPFTGTGFPKVFYLKYHMYPLYFPLMALARLGEW